MKRLFVLLFVLFCSAICNAETVTVFDSNSIIAAGDTYDTVAVKGDDTVVEITGGAITKLITMNDSKCIMSGGDVGRTYTYDTSAFHMSGGTLGSFYSFGKSAVDFSGTAIIDGGRTNDSSVLTISGNAELNVEGVSPRGQSTIKVLGGTCSRIHFDGGSPTVVISGGAIGNIGYMHGIVFSGSLRVVGYDLDAVPYGGDYGHGQVTGNWNDGTQFSINLSEGAYSFIDLYDGILPEDCTNRPEGDITGDCVVNLLDLSKVASDWLVDGTK